MYQWLFEAGAAGDITKASNGGYTPMHEACNGGHLSVCQWLFEVGASAVTKADNTGFSPMHWAARVATCRSASGCSRWAWPETSPRRMMMAPLPCTRLYGGHLSVCQWLFEVGAAGDITKTDNYGSTPCTGLAMVAPVVCQWLFGWVRLETSPRRTDLATLPCTRLLMVAYPVASGCSRWARPEISPYDRWWRHSHAQGLQGGHLSVCECCSRWARRRHPKRI